MSTSTGQSKNCEDYLVAMLASQLEKKLFELGMLSDRICGIPPVSHGETNRHPPFCKGQKTHDAPKSPSQSFTENPRFSPVLQNFSRSRETDLPGHPEQGLDGRFYSSMQTKEGTQLLLVLLETNMYIHCIDIIHS